MSDDETTDQAYGRRRQRWRTRRDVFAHRPFCDNLTGDGQDDPVYDALRAEYDLVGNVNTEALDINADVIGAAVLTFAYDTSTVNGVRPRR